MKRSSLPIPPLLSVVFLFLSSCGYHPIQSTQSPQSPESPVTPASGNYSLKLKSEMTAQTLDWGGYLSVSGDSVSVVAYDPEYSRCMDALIGPAAIAMTGTPQSSQLNLASAAFDGGNVLKITLSGSASPLTGTYAFEGGCNNDHGTLTATLVPPISGTWTSSFTINGQPVTVTADLTQASAPGAGGVIPISGSFTLSGASCYLGGSFDSSESYLWGDTVSMGTFATGVGVNFFVSGTLTNPADATTLSANYWFPKSVCSGATGSLQLNKQ